MRRKRAVYVITRQEAKAFHGRRAWSARYDSIDVAMGRPIHADMSVAPPWATRLTKRNRYAPEGTKE